LDAFVVPYFVLLDDLHGQAARVMRITASILIVLGLLLGPGYYLYGQHFNGRESTRVVLTERAQRWELPDGTVQRFPGRLAYRPVELSLHPDRNLALIALDFDMAPDSAADAADNVYLATLFEVDRPMLQREVRVDARAGAHQRVLLPAQVVRSPVTHLFVLEELNAAPRPVVRVTLTLREHADVWLELLMRIGIGLTIAGALLLGYDRFKPQGQR